MKDFLRITVLVILGFVSAYTSLVFATSSTVVGRLDFLVGFIISAGFGLLASLVNRFIHGGNWKHLIIVFSGLTLVYFFLFLLLIYYVVISGAF